MLLNILKCTGQLSQQRMICSKMSIMLRLRSPPLREEEHHKLGTKCNEYKNNKFQAYNTLLSFTYFIRKEPYKMCVDLLVNAKVNSREP